MFFIIFSYLKSPKTIKSANGQEIARCFLTCKYIVLLIKINFTTNHMHVIKNNFKVKWGSIFLLLVSMNILAASSDHFVTTWKTDNQGFSNNSSITIGTNGGGYSYSVDWNNDNIIDETGITGDALSLIHI